jgi:hypothetical protein
MREPVASTDASLFTRMFYDQLLPELSRRVNGSAATTDQLTADIQVSVYDRLCAGQPVGLAMSQYYQAIGALLLGHGRASADFDDRVGDDATDALNLALYTKVTAYDRACTVILGDPTVALSPPRAQPGGPVGIVDE